MLTTRRIATVVAVLSVFACGKSEQAAQDSAKAAAAPAPPPAPPAATLADYAGKWQVSATPEGGKDTTAIKFTLTATADTSAWTVEFPSGLKVPMTATLSGDSVLLKTGQFASQRRKNMKVWNDGAVRLQNGKMTGEVTAHYATSGADSVLKQRVDGTKLP